MKKILGTRLITGLVRLGVWAFKVGIFGRLFLVIGIIGGALSAIAT